MNNVKNIIFDLGGVILDIDYNITVDAFQKLGFEDFQSQFTQAKQSGLFDDFETGRISTESFIKKIKSLLPEEISKNEIVDAWNAMLLDFLPGRIEFLKEIKEKYRIFLFSNINAIHKLFVENLLEKSIGIVAFDELFIKSYYSHEFGFRKPHPEGFLKILEDNNLLAQETLFIDDSEQHIIGARKLGIQTIHLKEKSILDLGL